MLQVDIQNQSTIKRLYRRNDLTAIGQRICAGEGLDSEDAELSLLFCDDPFIQELNRQYRGKDEPTDVLSFQQDSPVHEGPTILGDIVISLETVYRFCNGNRAAMRDEIRLLFCHGMLHLLGHTHNKQQDREVMLQKQARYLGIQVECAWHK
jgi:probable rRNA maturation factor